MAAQRARESQEVARAKEVAKSKFKSRMSDPNLGIKRKLNAIKNTISEYSFSSDPDILLLIENYLTHDMFWELGGLTIGEQRNMRTNIVKILNNDDFKNQLFRLDNSLYSEVDGIIQEL